MKHKTITLNDIVVEKMGLSSDKLQYLLKQRLDEKEKLRKFASKIEKIPEIVSVYSEPLMEKK